MRASVLLFAAANSMLALAQTGTVPVGGECSSSDQCANGANCYGVTADTIEQCGNFQATCTSDSQCAYNTCNDGFCNGYKDLTTTAGSSTFATVTISSTSVAPSVTARSGTRGLGQTCDSSADCATGVDCYGVTAETIKTCGSFQASCTSDDDCATNTCQNGLCGGYLASSLYRIASTTAYPTSSATAA